jgi:5-methylcytosine-specific restriction endonuclease McrA
MNYRKLAFEVYQPICAYCGFGIKEILEVAHIDGNRSNNAVKNLVILCPNCHKMHDIDLIPTATVIQMRDRKRHVDWKKRLKDAANKAALTRKRSRAGKKAAATRAKNSRDSAKKKKSK